MHAQIVGMFGCTWMTTRIQVVHFTHTNAVQWMKKQVGVGLSLNQPKLKGQLDGWKSLVIQVALLMSYMRSSISCHMRQLQSAMCKGTNIWSHQSVFMKHLGSNYMEE
jgi:hypothetical protein